MTPSSASSEASPERLAGLFEDALRALPPVVAGHDLAPFAAACDYPLRAGGKRLRPVLLLATVQALGGDAATALPAAVALEWVHTFSLVHDDLPALDDDALRRGRPTAHVVYGEDVAVLVGDLLLAAAFRLVAGQVSVQRALGEGVEGMIHGQYLDIRPPEDPDEAWLRRMCSLKTGALIRAAVAMGLAHVDAPAPVAAAYRAFAEELGLGFQIVDDVLDATGTDETLGKPAGSDAAHSKRTFVTVLGLAEARRLAAESQRRCAGHLERLPGRPDVLGAVVARVYARDR